MKMFKYKMIKYFPYSASEEFINIGFWLWDENNNNKAQCYISNNHLKILAQCPYLNIDFIKKNIAKLKLEINENHWYGNHFRFGEFEAILHDSLESAKKFLYYKKIGEKFKGIKLKESSARNKETKSNTSYLIDTNLNKNSNDIHQHYDNKQSNTNNLLLCNNTPLISSFNHGTKVDYTSC